MEFKIVKMLLSSGANVNLKAKDGKSPFTLSFESGIPELLDILGGSIDLDQDPTLFFALKGPALFRAKL